MTVNIDALWFLLVAASITGGAAMLLNRLSRIDHALEQHGRKLVRIETKLNIVDREEL